LYSAENLRLCVMTPSWPIMSLNQVSAKAGQNPYRDLAGELFDLLFVIGFHGLGAFYEQFFDIAVIDEFPFLECCPPP
jgi:hypothetical protein